MAALSQDFSVGDMVEVKDDGAWVKASLLEQRTDKKWKVKFADFDQIGIIKPGKIRKFNSRKHFVERVEARKATESNPDYVAPKKIIRKVDNSKQGDALKDEGNQLFGKKKYREAIEKYSAAINLCPQNHVYYANRAMGYLKIDENDLAESDCTASINISQDYVKAYVRRGWARKKNITNLLSLADCERDFDRALELDPQNRAARGEKKMAKENEKSFKEEIWCK